MLDSFTVTPARDVTSLRLQTAFADVAGALPAGELAASARISFMVLRPKLQQQPNGPELEPVVFVLDDDRVVREALGTLLGSAGYSVVSLSSAEELFQRLPVNAPACLVLDVALHGTNGFELQQQLSERAHILPIVFVAGQGDISMSVRAIKAGAVAFLPKPFSDEELLSGIQQGLDEANRSWKARQEQRTLHEHYDQLTQRERQVLLLIVSGLMNKQVALELSIAEATVKIHRGHVMHKMRAGSFAELVRMASRIGLPIRRTENDI